MKNFLKLTSTYGWKQLWPSSSQYEPVSKRSLYMPGTKAWRLTSPGQRPSALVVLKIIKLLSVWSREGIINVFQPDKWPLEERISTVVRSKENPRWSSSHKYTHSDAAQTDWRWLSSFHHLSSFVWRKGRGKGGIKNVPDTQQVPDHQFWVEAVQAEGHPGRRDAVGCVEDVSGQGAGVCHCCHG